MTKEARPGGRAVSLALGMVGVAAVAYGVYLGVRFGTAVDFGNYAASAQRWLSGGGLYDPAQLSGPYVLARTSARVFDYPPPAMLLVWPLTWGGYVAFSLLSVAVYVSGLRRMGARTEVIAVLLIPAVFAIAIGNLTLILAGLLAWAYAGRAGIVGGLGLLLKLTTGAIAGLDGIRGVLIAVGLAVGVVVLTWPLVGAWWPDYALAMKNARPFCESAISVGCVASPEIALLAGGGLTLAAILVKPRYARLALVTAAILVTTMELQPYDSRWIYLAPLVAGLVRRGAAPQARGWSTSAPPWTAPAWARRARRTGEPSQDRA